MQGNAANSGAGNRVSAPPAAMADKGAVGFKTCVVPRFPFEGIAGDMRHTDIHSLEKLSV